MDENRKSDARRSVRVAASQPEAATAYTWDILNDRLDWQPNAADVLGLASTADLSNSAGLQAHMVPEHLTRWRDAILGGTPPSFAEEGVPYRVHYRFLPGGQQTERTIWLEDKGRWWPGADGRPRTAHGTLRIIDDRYLEEQRLLEVSSRDTATRPGSSAQMADALAATIRRAHSTRQPSAFLIVSVNGLGDINSEHGFDVGDEVIAAVERLLRTKMRGADLVSRFTSNKFGLILNDCTQAAMRLSAERLATTLLNTRIKTSVCDLSASVTIGGVCLPDQARTVAEAMSRAMTALEMAREAGSTMAVAVADMPDRRGTKRRKSDIGDEILQALEEHRMRFVLQPIVDAATGTPAMYECLLRMVEADGTIVPAGQFIEVAEEVGLARKIDRCTLGLAVPLLEAHPDLTLSVNVSSLTTSNYDWIIALQRLTGGRRDLLERLVVEITETAMIRDIDETAAFVNVLRDLGCRVAIDDFGAGYTSFLHLKALKLDVLKIDGAFIKDLATNQESRALVRSLIDVARVFALKTVAEWVQDAETAQLLKGMGIDYLQGYYYGEPVTPDKLPKQPAKPNG